MNPPVVVRGGVVVGGGDQASRLRALAGAAARPAPGAGSVPSVGAVVEGARPARAVGRSAKIVAVASGKGGVGKSNVAVNVAIALSAPPHRLRVTLLDADLGTANADVLCGLMPRARLEEVAAGVRSMREIAVEAPGGFRLVPGSAGIARMADLPAVHRERLVGAVAELEADADVVIVDTAAGVGAAVTSFLRLADMGVVVTTPEPPAIADAYALIKCVAGRRGAGGGGETATATAGSGGLALVVNQVADAAEAAAVHARIAGVCARFLGLGLPMLGHVAHDLRVVAAVRQRRPLLVVDPRAPASRDVRAVAGAVAQRLGVGQGAGVAGGVGRGPSGEPAGSRLRGLFARLLGGHETVPAPDLLKTV